MEKIIGTLNPGILYELFTPMKRGLLDQDIRPTERLHRHVENELDVTIGVTADETDLIEALHGVDVLFTSARLPVSRTVIEGAPHLELIAKIGTGLDNLDLDAAEEFGIPVTYTPGINALPVAEHTIGLLLTAIRRVTECETVMKAGGWRDETPLGSQLSGATVGIIGFGNIGSRVANLLSGFNIELLAHDPYIEPIDTEITGAELTDLPDLLRRSDFITVNAELNEETRGMIGDQEFALMDSETVLVNTARGPIIQQEALIDALRNQKIAAASLDVFETEPLPAESPLYDLERAILTPHIGAWTEEAATASIDQLADNTLRLLNDKSVKDRYMAVKPQ